MVNAMNDQYILKYIPVMTEEGKLAHFGDHDDFDPHLSEQAELDKYSAYVDSLLNDNELDSVLDTLFEDQDKPKRFNDFKNRLVKLIAKTRMSLNDLHQHHKESTTTQLKKDADLMRQSMEKLNFSDSYKNRLRELIQEQLLDQVNHTDPFLAFCDADSIVDFLENASPLMQRCAKEVYEDTRNLSGRNVEKLETKEKRLKQNLANKMAVGIHFWLSIKVSSTHEADFPTVFDQLFVLCCKKAGFGIVKSKSEQTQNAVKYLKTLVSEQDFKNKI